MKPSTCGSCPALWSAYLELEVAAGRPEAACRILLRAVQQCPGAKALWCAGFAPPLLELQPDRQLRDALQFMSDKELRLRRELPELGSLAP